MQVNLFRVFIFDTFGKSGKYYGCDPCCYAVAEELLQDLSSYYRNGRGQGGSAGNGEMSVDECTGRLDFSDQAEYIESQKI